VASLGGDLSPTLVDVAELVDALGLGSSRLFCGGSSPLIDTNISHLNCVHLLFIFMKAANAEPLDFREFPEVILRVREDGEFVDKNTHDLFRDKKVIVFGVPGAFTPTCSTAHLPGFEKLYFDFINHGIDEVYCHSVNDSFTMKAWFESLGVFHVKPLADGNAHLAAMMNTLVTKINCGFGLRTWRYCCMVDNLETKVYFEEAGKKDDYDGDPFDNTSADQLFDWVQAYHISSL
jgi:thioredoxin-dependent peroxiredoxin